jgi:hypothetical protein
MLSMAYSFGFSLDNVNYQYYDPNLEFIFDQISDEQIFYVRADLTGYSFVEFQGIETTSSDIFELVQILDGDQANTYYYGDKTFTFAFKIKKGKIGNNVSFTIPTLFNLGGTNYSITLTRKVKQIVPNFDLYVLEYNQLQFDPDTTGLAGIIYLPEGVPYGHKFRVRFRTKNLIGDNLFRKFTSSQNGQYVDQLITDYTYPNTKQEGWDAASGQNIQGTWFDGNIVVDLQLIINESSFTEGFFTLETQEGPSYTPYTYKFYVKTGIPGAGETGSAGGDTEPEAPTGPSAYYPDAVNFPVNWRDPVTQKIEYKTAVSTLANGHERRQPVYELPKEMHSFTITLDRDQSAEFVNKFTVDEFELFQVFDFLNDKPVMTLTSNIYNSDTYALKEYSVPDVSIFENESQVLCEFQNGTYKQLTATSIDYVNSTVSVTLNTDTPPEELRIISPVSAFIRGVNFSRLTDYHHEAKINLELTTSRSINIANPELFDGYPLFKMKHNWTSDPTLNIQPMYDDFDSEQGVLTRSKIHQATQIHGHSYTLKSHDVYALIGLFHYCKGSHLSFLSEDESDLIILDDNQTDIQNAIVVNNNESFIKQKEYIYAVKIYFTDGTFVIKTVDDIVKVGDKVNIMISNQEIYDYTHIHKVKPLYFTRFYGDIMQVEWKSDSVAHVKCAFKLLKE